MTEWATLKDVFAHVKGIFLSPFIAEREILKCLEDGVISARTQHIEQINTNNNMNTLRRFSRDGWIAPAMWQYARLLPEENSARFVIPLMGNHPDPAFYDHFIISDISFPSDQVLKIWATVRQMDSTSVQAQMRDPKQEDFLKSRQGAKASYDWEAIIIEAAALIYMGGLPNSEAELIRMMYEWMQDPPRAAEKLPSEAQMKKHLSPLYKRIRSAEDG